MPRCASLAVLAIVVTALALGLSSRPAGAGSSWRCGNRLVVDGSSALEVGRICGPPEYRTASVEYVAIRVYGGNEILQAVPVEVWTYNRGPRQFIRYLTFRNGHLVDICEGEYGW
ncbi:MAG TPA: DUF2845 domain-containing protein [Candidatus Binatia bacterium]|nr:DUF2845 domain-containing protein [Candidatus Binatia bacterium]